MASSVWPTQPCTRTWVSSRPPSHRMRKTATAAAASLRTVRGQNPCMSGLSGRRRAGRLGCGGFEAGGERTLRLAEVTAPRSERRGGGGQPGEPDQPATDDVADVVHAETDPGVPHQEHNCTPESDQDRTPRGPYVRKTDEQERSHRDDRAEGVSRREA